MNWTGVFKWLAVAATVAAAVGAALHCLGGLAHIGG